MMAPGIDKGDGLLRLARHYGIHPDETMALGDAENDIEMLRAAAVGVAMANAPPQVRAAASFVTKRTNNEAGVAEAIRRFAFERS
jgi:hydroxymethylpyrimidine pyrophosphatase-like HAD family hydrolase